jgi:protein-disulfide isomerase
MHPHAEKAAEAALCAGAQGKYWEYHDRLFKVKELEVPQLKESAAALQLDTKAFDECLDSGKQAAAIKTQAAEGQALQIQGTPSFLINGRFFSGGLSYEDFQRIVEEELKGSSAPQRAAR